MILVALDPSALDAALPAHEVLARLEPAVQELVIANRELFRGRWEDFAEDVRRRQAGKPYLFKIDLALGDPLAWIVRLQAYEAARGERLADSLPD